MGQPLFLSGRETPGSSQIVQLQFKPSSVGNHSTVLNIESNDRNVAVALQGAGIAPVVPLITVTPLDMGFGDAAIGSRGSREIIISNPGTAPLTISSIGLTGSSAFHLPLMLFPFRLAQNGARKVAITFQPLTAGSHTGTLRVNSNASTPVVTVQLHGASSSADVRVSMTAIDYGNLSGSLSRTRTLGIDNVGVSPMTCNLQITNERNTGNGAPVNVFRIQGAWLNPGSGSQQPISIPTGGKSLTIPPASGNPATIPPSGTLLLDIQFVPGGVVGPMRADLIIATNDPDPPTVTVSLQGILT